MINVAIVENLISRGSRKLIKLEDGLEYHLQLIEIPERADRKEGTPYAMIPITSKGMADMDLVQFLTALESKIAIAKKNILAGSGTRVK